MRLAILLLALAANTFAQTPQIVSIKKIWDQAPHQAFGDIIRFKGKWFATFREGLSHVARKEHPTDDGKLRVITSDDGDTWRSTALLTEDGIDLRDPHLSLTADGRLMIVAGGSIYRNAVFGGRQPRVAFSKDGTTWTKPAKVLEEGHWLWRVTWHEGWAYGVSKYPEKGIADEKEARRTVLVRSRDGLKWEKITNLNVPGSDETAVRFLPDGRMMALIRCSWGKDNFANIGIASAPYKDWKFASAGAFIGGPNLIALPDGRVYGGGRYFKQGYGKNPVTVLAKITPTGYERLLEFPSGGDNSYPGYVWHDGLLWMLYYSSHEGKTSIYLAKVKL